MTSAILADPLIEPLPEARRRGYSLHSFRKKCVDFHWHFHPELELIHVVRGRGVRYVGRSVEPYAGGDLCLLGANLPHAFGSHTADRNGAEWVAAHFLPQAWGDSFWELPEARQMRNLLVQSPRGIRFDPAEAKTCLKLLRELERRPVGARRLASWLEILDRLAALRRRHYLNPGPAASTRAHDSRLSRLLAWIDERADDDISQAQVAREFGMSPQALCRFFREKTGKVFHRYLNEVRVARGCCALLHSESRISEIAFRSGFNNLSNFNRRFREITGRTPRQYREMQGGLA